MTYPHHPRFGSNYRGLTGRLDLLLECYSYLEFEERVHVASAWQIETLAWLAQHAREVNQVVAASRLPPERVAVRYALHAHDEPVTILTRSPRALEGEPCSVELPYLARFVGTTVVDRPRAYAVPRALGEHLAAHGLRVEAAAGHALVQVARVESLGAAAGRKILEAGSTGEIAVSWRSERRALPDGYWRVDTEQPLGAIAVYLCEPESDDGAVENGLVPAPAAGEEFPVWRLLAD